MNIVKGQENTHYLNKTNNPAIKFKKEENSIELSKKSKVADYFDYIYRYPQKIKIKWDVLDELKDDLFVNYNLGESEKDFSLNNFKENQFFAETAEEALAENYSLSKYLNSFLNKVNSSNFFLKKTNKVQTALSNIPVFVILNGQKEIVLTKPSNILGSNPSTAYITQKLHDSFGDFQSALEKKVELGLFFLNPLDAEKYLKEIARADFEGTQTVGLSVNCISLDSAYRITREDHPEIDFRFVPNFNEVKELLLNSIGKSDLIVDEEQHQLRFRYRSPNMFPYFKKLGNYFSFSSSFLQRNEYFKGVPIYIVQVNENPRNFLSEQYFKILGNVDSVFSRCLQSIDYTFGFGHNWVLEGSLKNVGNSDQVENFIFFEKDQAIEFTKKNAKKVMRFNGARSSKLSSVVKKPKIFVYNLEDFLEDWEDFTLGKLFGNNNLETVFNCKAVKFISPINSLNEISSVSKNYVKSPLSDFNQTIQVKFRVLKRAIGVFFSV